MPRKARSGELRLLWSYDRPMRRYDGIADEYAIFQKVHAEYYQIAQDALRRLLRPGSGPCLDVGCGGGRFLSVIADLGWQPVGVDESADQLRVARERLAGVDLICADATSLPFQDATIAAGISMFTHTDLDEFTKAIAEVVRVMRPGSPFVYVGNHPCFVGPVQEHTDAGVPRLHPGYRRGGRVDSSGAPGVPGAGWRSRLGSFVHLPLGNFVSAFAGLTIVRAEELDDGWEYPKTIALAFAKP